MFVEHGFMTILTFPFVMALYAHRTGRGGGLGFVRLESGAPPQPPSLPLSYWLARMPGT